MVAESGQVRILNRTWKKMPGQIHAGSLAEHRNCGIINLSPIGRFSAFTLFSRHVAKTGMAVAAPPGDQVEGSDTIRIRNALTIGRLRPEEPGYAVHLHDA